MDLASGDCEDVPLPPPALFPNDEYGADYLRTSNDLQLTGDMNLLTEHEKKIIIEFCHLLEKSKQLFNGLRELPQYGHRQWNTFFAKTFRVYTKLWKFQQIHRGVLNTKYGMKRWQVGEIASKIGQLYYHFYLRTSETAYLAEAYTFYSTIRLRCYYTKASQEDKSKLMVKNLRYCARFIVVSILLNQFEMVKDLIRELEILIADYGYNYNVGDQNEWRMVLDEVKEFMTVEPAVKVKDTKNKNFNIKTRITKNMDPELHHPNRKASLTLHQVVIVGSTSNQVKVSELTHDMFRMVQAIEREPTSNIKQLQYEEYNAPKDKPREYYYTDGMPLRDNPHKYLLYKPSPSQLLVYLASGCNELPQGGVLLLYISADGHFIAPSKNPVDASRMPTPQATASTPLIDQHGRCDCCCSPDSAEETTALLNAGWECGGLITTSRSDLNKIKCRKAGMKENACLHPGDLAPFTRRALFIIIDSDNSHVFNNIPRHFRQPLVVLMSPTEYPSPLNDRKNQGNLFTLFLNSPLLGFCQLCFIDTITDEELNRSGDLIEIFQIEAFQLLTKYKINSAYTSFMSDVFLRIILTRYIFCEVAMRCHKAFKGRTITQASPPLPEEILGHLSLARRVNDLAGVLQVRSHFIEVERLFPPKVLSPKPARVVFNVRSFSSTRR